MAPPYWEWTFSKSKFLPKNWKFEKSLSRVYYTPSRIKSQFLWFNKDGRIVNKPFHLKILKKKKLFISSGDLKARVNLDLKSQVSSKESLNKTITYSWIQMTHIIPGEWECIIRNTHISSTNISLDQRYVVKKDLIISLEKLKSKYLFKTTNHKKSIKLTSKDYFTAPFR